MTGQRKMYLDEYFAARQAKRRRGSKPSSPRQSCPPYDHKNADPSVLLGANFPFSCAPTLNEYKHLCSIKDKHGNKFAIANAHKRARRIIDDAILVFRYRRTEAKRRVLVTRHTSGRLDEVSVDVCGGKLLLDVMVSAGVLVDDSPEWCEREARVVNAPPGSGFVTVEVFAVGGDDD